MADPPRKAPEDAPLAPTLVNPRKAKLPYENPLEPGKTAPMEGDGGATAELDAHAPPTQRLSPVQDPPTVLMASASPSLEPETRPAPAEPGSPSWPAPGGVTQLLRSSEPPQPAGRPRLPPKAVPPPASPHAARARHPAATALGAAIALALGLLGYGAVKLAAPRRISVRIASEPEANVFVGGTDLGPQPVVVDLPVGPATVVLRNATRGLQRSFNFDVALGGSSTQRFVFPKGWLELDAPPAMSVTVDGDPCLVRKLELYEGLHRVEASDAQQRREVRTVDVTGGGTTRVSFQPP